MAPFPSPLERTVASALLLLSTMPPLPQFGFRAETKRVISSSSVSSGSELSSSSVITSGSSKTVRFLTVVGHYHDIKLEVVRKRRSQVTWSTKNKKLILGLPSKSKSMSTSAEDSCLSTTSTSRSYMRREVGMKKIREKGSNGSGSAHMRRQADNILRLLSAGGCHSEVNIRQVLGDSPDTSKALRMLLRRGKVKRSGGGGRVDPYIYKIA